MKTRVHFLLASVLSALSTFAVPVVFESATDMLYDASGSQTAELQVADRNNLASRTSLAGSIQNQIGFTVAEDLIDISVTTSFSRNNGAGELHADTTITFTVLETVHYSLSAIDTLDERGLFGSSRRRLALIGLPAVVSGDAMVYRDAGTYEYTPTLGDLTGVLEPGIYAFRWDTLLEGDPENGLAANSGSTTALLRLWEPVPDAGPTALLGLIGIGAVMAFGSVRRH